MNKLKIRPDILTTSGFYFNFLEPENSRIEVFDIANALSRICRFNGQLLPNVPLYSVAQHSLHVSDLVPNEHKLVALMHDAAEAYIGDITKPLKQLLPDYKVIEKRVHKAIFERFGLDPELPDCVKHADMVALATEQRDFMHAHDDEWQCLAGVHPSPDVLIPLDFEQVRASFIRRFVDLWDYR